MFAILLILIGFILQSFLHVYTGWSTFFFSVAAGVPVWDWLVLSTRYAGVLCLLDCVGHQQLVLDDVHDVYRDAIPGLHQQMAPV